MHVSARQKRSAITMEQRLGRVCTPSQAARGFRGTSEATGSRSCIFTRILTQQSEASTRPVLGVFKLPAFDPALRLWLFVSDFTSGLIQPGSNAVVVQQLPNFAMDVCDGGVIL